MPITTLDGAIAGMRVPQPIIKTGIAMSAVGGQRGYSLFYAAGNPGAGVAPSPGINGAAQVGPLAGCITRNNPTAGQNAHLARLSLNASQAGSLWLIDRLWANSGLSATSTTAQAITPAALPARDQNASANGAGVMAAIEWSATGGAGTPAVTITYTDQDGNAGATGSLTGVTTPPVGTFEIFTLAAGDTGIRSVQSFIQNATRTSGTFHLVLFRLLAQVDVPLANVGSAIDALTAGLPQIYDNSCLNFVWFPASTTATNFFGQYVETQG